MANSDVFPQDDNGFDLFQDNFMTEINANKVAWKIDATQLAALALLQPKWVNSWNVCKIKATATTSQRKTKDQAKKQYEAKLRPFIQAQVYGNPAMTDSDRIDCGLKPRKDTHTPQPVPGDAPLVIPEPKIGLMADVFFKQQPGNDGSSHRGKPEGVQFCKMVYIIGTTAPASPAVCTQTKLASRSPFKMEFEPSDEGKKIFGYCCWVNSKGEDGPYSVMFSFKIV